MKYKLKEKDLDCSHFKMWKHGMMEACICNKKFRGVRKRLRLYFKMDKMRLKEQD